MIASRKNVSLAIIKGGRQAVRLPLGWARKCGFDDGTKVKITFIEPRGRGKGWIMVITKVLNQKYASGTGIVSLHLEPGNRNLDFMQQSQEFIFGPIMRSRKVRALFNGDNTIEIPFPVEVKRITGLIERDEDELVGDEPEALPAAEPAAALPPDKPLTELANGMAQLFVEGTSAMKIHERFRDYARGRGVEDEDFDKMLDALIKEIY